MAIPANYDSTVMRVDPGDLYDAQNTIKLAYININDYLGEINKALDFLYLAWTGPGAAAEMKDFTERWNDAMTQLFGTTENPELGVLNILAGGVYAASTGYAGVETKICHDFLQFRDALGGAGDLPKNATDEVVDEVYHTTAVNETGFPTSQ